MSRRLILRISLAFAAALLMLVLAGVLLARKPVPAHITYGLSFNTLYAEELGLDPEETYTALLDELGVRHVRLAAHWSMIEPSRDRYDFSALDYQIAAARARGVDVILGVGRRLPRWPECHTPEWAGTLSWDVQKEEVRAYITAVVGRYKDEPHITYWQVENEPYLEVFANEHCGDLDEAFLKEEVALVRSLDSTRPILMTDSGNLGTWSGAYQLGDAFGTSVYVYFWNPDLGPFRTILPPVTYRIKDNLMALLYGEKQTFLIELAAEPWLLEPVTEVSLDVQLSRMNPELFAEIVAYARDTRYARQYLWGGEWWYWLREQGEPEMWKSAAALFAGEQ